MMLYDELSIYTNKNNFITNYIYMCRDNLYIKIGHHEYYLAI